MAKGRKLSASVLGILLSLSLALQANMTVFAGGSSLEDMRGGVASLLNPSVIDTFAVADAAAKESKQNPQQEEESQSTLVMANVKSALNVRSEANESPDGRQGRKVIQGLRRNHFGTQGRMDEAAVGKHCRMGI